MNGTYGTRKPAYITSSDCDIYYYYRPNRSSQDNSFGGFKKLPSTLLANTSAPKEEGDGSEQIILPGAYDLRLPLNYFGKVGIYTVYIKPKEIYGKITDVSTLTAFQNVNGIIINSDDFVDMPMYEANGLTGYRVEYFDNAGNRRDFYRFITSSNKCEPVAQNMTNSNQKGVTYRFNESSNLIFCTLTPSTGMSFKSNSTPYIGSVNERIALINTKFNPVMMEIEITEHDIETLATMLEGDQIRNLDAGLITTFNENGDIYHQAKYANIINTNEGIHHDVKINNTETIDFGEREKYNKIVNNV